MKQIRKAVKTDINGMVNILHTIELFPPEMLDEMIKDFLYNPNSKDIWFVKVENDEPVALGYCAPEQLTDGTFNLYAIGVQKALQGQGIGQEMMIFIEDLLKSQGQRLLIVETSSSPALSKARRFYEKLNYTKEAVIRDFWGEGDDKIIYWKKL